MTLRKVDLLWISDPRWRPVGFMAPKLSLEQVFFEYFGFPPPILIPPTAPYSLIMISDYAV
jgi:hypothetical protein